MGESSRRARGPRPGILPRSWAHARVLGPVEEEYAKLYRPSCLAAAGRRPRSAYLSLNAFQQGRSLLTLAPDVIAFCRALP